MKKHILIIDDSTDQQNLLKLLLEAKGHTADCTSSGKEAFVLLNSSLYKKPQLILLDLNMPVMDGFAFRIIQRTDPALKDIPTIIMSGEDDIQSIHEKTNAEVIQKPLNISRLLQLIEKTPSSLHS